MIHCSHLKINKQSTGKQNYQYCKQRLSDIPTSDVSLRESRTIRMNKQKFVTFTKMVSESVTHTSNLRPDLTQLSLISNRLFIFESILGYIPELK